MIRGMAALGLALAMMCGRAAAAPLEAYGGLPNIEDVQLSPDGVTLAVMISNGDQRGLIIKPVGGGDGKTYGMGDTKVRRIDWAGPDHVIITTSRTTQIVDVIAPRQEWFLGTDLDIRTGKMEPLLKHAPGRGGTGTNLRDRDSGKGGMTLNVLYDAPEVRTVRGKPTLFLKGVSFPAGRGVLTVFEVDLKSGDAHYGEIGDRNTADFVLGQDGVALARSRYDVESGRWALQLKQGAGWKEVKSVEAKNDRPYLIGLGRDGRSILVGQMEADRYTIREVGPEGVWSEPLDVDDSDGPIYDPETHALIGFRSLKGDEDSYTFFDPADQKAWNSVKAAFKGDRVLLQSWSHDRRKIVVLADSRTEGPAYALVDLDAKSANWLGGRYQKLTPADISPVQGVKFKARDGLDLSGYLTVPHGAEPRNLPLVVFPHGGPASRDTPSFHWWAQAMASRGYAVLQVNFRGSDGFGQAFLEAGYGEWGRKMQTDLSDGVRHLAARGVIDPKRVCIVGGSYGGYAALAGVTLDPGVYRCAASVAGLSDLRRFVNWSRNQDGLAAQRYWTRFMGAETRRDPSLAEISPITHAARAEVPVLLIHGRDDTVVPLEQSQVMADALRRAGKPVELVVQPGADHWLSRGETRLATLQAVVAFLEKHNPAR